MSAGILLRFSVYGIGVPRCRRLHGSTTSVRTSAGTASLHLKELDMAWFTLLLAGILEIGWAIGLKYTDGFTRLTPTVLTVGGDGA